ncbi:hypothetical protein [Staphylococcus sp. 17KM0847]|uniref:hypothetical protein n=1 Tax=Staphylococcus sp. 17KM0847 TaxID=2583989 RepID=UPI0015DC6BFB|nr:hypothetical protein [Staphylococcus sp. 17KM0847]QLK86889.1 hypothetical protein FGL66_09365 [Staphylococcus sp. 17KM0847]
MKVIGDLKGLFKFEKKFNTDLMPAKLSVEDISDLILFLCFQIISFLLILINIIFTKKDNFLMWLDLIIIGVFLLCSLAIFSIFKDDIERHNLRYLFYKELKTQNGEGESVVSNEPRKVYKIDRYFYDITEKKTIQYTLKEEVKGADEKNDLKFNARYVKTRLLENDNSYELIETFNGEKYKSGCFLIWSIVQVCSCVISLGLSLIEDVKNIYCLILIHGIPALFAIIWLWCLVQHINFNAEKENISKIMKEL